MRPSHSHFSLRLCTRRCTGEPFVFTGGTAFNLVLGYLGVLVFSGLTAYDLQRLKKMRQQEFANAESAEKLAIFGALRLYLDFINLFISLLRIFGGGRR